MSWAADLFHWAVTAAGVPVSDHHTVAQAVVAGGALGLICFGFLLLFGAAFASEEDRRELHIRARLPQRRRLGTESSVRTAKEA